MQNKGNLVWLDMEMTGLDPEIDTVLEIATIVTDAELNTLAEGPSIAIKHSKEALDTMSPWCIDHHGRSGLTQRCLDSQTSLEEAEQQTLAFLEKWVAKGEAPLCGNSIGQDRRFIYKYMPTLADYLHYRSVDVSTLKELARRWQPHLLKGIEKKAAHLAMDDIRESIEEMRYWRKHFIKG